jgi:hypothetical protein
VAVGCGDYGVVYAESEEGDEWVIEENGRGVV